MLTPEMAEDQVDEALAWYFEAEEAGQAPDLGELYARYPDLAERLADFFACDQRFRRLTDTLVPRRTLSVKPQSRPDSNSAISSDRWSFPFPDISDVLTVVEDPRQQELLGDYELISILGRGGMGVVYRARQLVTNRIVALKTIMAGPDATPDEVERFTREVEAIAHLDHPHIIPIYEVGEQAGRRFFSMKLAENGSLANLLKKASPDQRRTVRILSQVARAVHHAHQRGVLHRDLKPGNIVLGVDDNPYVTDFGLARRVEGDSSLTQTGAIVGTPAYMAPEQAHADKRLSTAVDVYGLGAILYECLTGRPPFRGPNPLEVMLAVMHQEPALPRSVRPQVDRDLETICLKCMHRDPSGRYDSAGALADELDRWLAGEPINARPIGVTERTIKWARRHPGWSAFAGFCLLLVMVSFLAWFQYQRRLDADRAHFLVESFRTATPGEMLRMMPGLRTLRLHAEPHARELLVRSRAKGTEPLTELNAALLLVQWEPAEVDFVLERILSASPEDLIAFRELLAPQADLVKQRLAPLVTDRGAARPKRLRAQAILAREGGTVPTGCADDLVGQMLIEDRLLLSGWIRALTPVRHSLVDALIRQYCQGGDGEAGIGAAWILREFLQEETDRIPEFLEQGGPRQVYLLAQALRNSPEATSQLLRRWNRSDRERFQSVAALEYWVPAHEVEDREARSQTKLALALIAAGKGASVWHALEQSENPRVRTNLIHALFQVQLPPQVLKEPLALTAEPTVRQAVYLAWGSYSPDRWSNAEFEELVRQVIEDFEHHPDPGVHSAAHWLLRQWKTESRLKPILARLPRQEQRGQRRWFVHPSGMTFAVIPGPCEVVMGSAGFEPGHYSNPQFGPEYQHTRWIDHTYAIATTEVTIAQFEQFYRECKKYLNPALSLKSWSARHPDGPAVYLNWYEAAMFCRWLSEKDKIPEEQRCYPSLDRIRPGMILPADHLDRTGYRLPTEAEWEHACRAGSRTPYWFGSEDELLTHHAWFDRNAGMQTHSVGLRRPNPFGLFDVHGNVFEWCGSRAEEYPSMDSIRPPRFSLPDRHACNAEDLCVLRGGDFTADPTRLRCAHRKMVQRKHSWPGSGLRLARTMHLNKLALVRMDSNETKITCAVRGTPGTFRVTGMTGGITCDPVEGQIPGTITVSSANLESHPWSLRVSRTDENETRELAEQFLPAKWRIRWSTWQPEKDSASMPASEKAWERATKANPVYEETTYQIGFPKRERHPDTRVPGIYSAMVATTEISVPAGLYRFEGATHIHGFRVFLDGEWLLEQNWNRQILRPAVNRYLTAGKHTLRVEYCKVLGHEAFDFQIRKLSLASPPGEVIWAGQSGLSQATFEVTGTGCFRIKDVSAGLTVTPRNGQAPATIQVTGKNLHDHPFAFTLEQSEKKLASREQVRIWGTLAPGRLHIQPMRTNSLGMTLSLIPGGQFLQGSPPDVIASLWNQHAYSYLADRLNVASEGPLHPVRIGKDYGLGIHEVTVGEFRQFVQATKFVTLAEREGGDIQLLTDHGWIPVNKGYSWWEPHNTRSESHPVVLITWHDAQAFCQWLSEKEGIHYRLPSEAEWEYACRAGTQTRWFFGENPALLDRYAWHRHNSMLAVNPVGRKKPNPWGLFDVYGNVHEWCQDTFDPSYYGKREFDNPQGPADWTTWCVLRGSALWFDHRECRSASRWQELAARTGNLIGFRVASAGWKPTFQVWLKQARYFPVHEYAVNAGSNPPAIAVQSGEVTALVAGEAPMWTVQVCGKGEKSTAYSLQVRVPGRTEKLVAGTLLGNSWDVRFHAYPEGPPRFALIGSSLFGTCSGNVLTTLPVAAHAIQPAAYEPGGGTVLTEEEWKRLVATPPVHRCRVSGSALNLQPEVDNPALPAFPLAVIAESELNLSREMAGEYRLAVASDIGVRVSVDGTLVVDAWNPATSHLLHSRVILKSGTHRVRLECLVQRHEPDVRLSVTRVQTPGE